MIQSLETGKHHELNVRGEMARYVAPGYLIVGRNSSLLAAPFSLDDMQVQKPPVTVVDGVNGDPSSGTMDFSVSSNGNLAYLPGSVNKDFELVWVTREGKVTPLPLAPQPISAPRISPDGTKLAYGVGPTTGDNDIWIYDFRKRSASRLTFTKKVNSPLWSLDGKRLYYASSVPPMEVRKVCSSSRARFPRFPLHWRSRGIR